MKTAEKIWERALYLFAENGYAGTSVDAIAQAAGIKKSTLYSHVKSKDALFLALFEDALRWDLGFFRDLLAAHRDQSAEEKLHLMFRHDFDIYCGKETESSARMKLVHTAMLFPPAELRQQMIDLFAVYEEKFSAMMLEVIGEGVAAGAIAGREPAAVLAWYYCVVDGLFLDAYYYEKAEYRKRFDHIWSMFWDSIKSK